MDYDFEADHEETTQRLAAMDATLLAIHGELDDIQAQMDVLLDMAQTILEKLEGCEHE
jgi:hypothetical protein